MFRLGGSFKVHESATPAALKGIFAEHEPMGGTVLAPVLERVFADHLKAKAAGQMKANGTMLLVITDGQPQDEAKVAQAIIAFTKKLENGDDEFGSTFIQVGKDPAATAFLKKLDDDLEKQGAKFDIVDTKTIDEVEQIGLTETLLAALTD